MNERENSACNLRVGQWRSQRGRRVRPCPVSQRMQPRRDTHRAEPCCYNPCEGETMTNLGGVVETLKKERDRLSREMKAVVAALSAFGAEYGKAVRPRSTMSASGRARIAAAQRARWAKVKGKSKSAN